MGLFSKSKKADPKQDNKPLVKERKQHDSGRAEKLKQIKKQLDESDKLLKQTKSDLKKRFMKK